MAEDKSERPEGKTVHATDKSRARSRAARHTELISARRQHVRFLFLTPRPLIPGPLVRHVCCPPLCHPTGMPSAPPFALTPSAHTSSLQSRRSAFARLARFASTSAKAPTLKERLAELIPAEIENVRPFLCAVPRPGLNVLAIGESGARRAWQEVVRPRPRRPALWVRLSRVPAHTPRTDTSQRHARPARAHLGGLRPRPRYAPP